MPVLTVPQTQCSYSVDVWYWQYKKENGTMVGMKDMFMYPEHVWPEQEQIHSIWIRNCWKKNEILGLKGIYYLNNLAIYTLYHPVMFETPLYITLAGYEVILGGTILALPLIGTLIICACCCFFKQR